MAWPLFFIIMGSVSAVLSLTQLVIAIRNAARDAEPAALDELRQRVTALEDQLREPEPPSDSLLRLRTGMRVRAFIDCESYTLGTIHGFGANFSQQGELDHFVLVEVDSGGVPLPFGPGDLELIEEPEQPAVTYRDRGNKTMN